MFLRSLATLVAAALLSPLSIAQEEFIVTPYGPTCGPIANGVITPIGATYRFAFTVTQATGHNHVMVILGVDEQAIPLDFGTPCLLLTDLAFTQIHMTDTSGSYTWSHALPKDFMGIARVQFADIIFDAENNLTVLTSNGVRLEYR